VKQAALSVHKLNVSVRSASGTVNVVKSVSFDLAAGEVLALVGESGCGKTKTAEAIMRLIPHDIGQAQADTIELNGVNLEALPEKRMRDIRGRKISMVFQEPLTALDPVFTIGSQLSSVYRRHRGQSKRKARASSVDMLDRVGIADSRRIMKTYPHQLSGGMRQRVMISMAMACQPRVLIADEPTTALDVTTQAQVLSQLVGLGHESGTSILLITHDLGIVAQYCDRAMVMLHGQIVEEAGVTELFSRPQHPYTRELLAACPGAAVL
jgi:ABC-type dipeptide/oligopeptide/nickel transport system ATPase component